MSEAERLHRHLIGQQGSRRSLNTPALVLDLDMLDRNIAEMASFAKAHKVNLRPHSKTHKSADIARRQIKAGALGLPFILPLVGTLATPVASSAASVRGHVPPHSVVQAQHLSPILSKYHQLSPIITNYHAKAGFKTL